jgi:hypothetical protein
MDDTPIQRFLVDGAKARDPATLQALFEKIVARPATPAEIEQFRTLLKEAAPK